CRPITPGLQVARGIRKVVCVAALGSYAGAAIALYQQGSRGALRGASLLLRRCGNPWLLVPGARDAAAVRLPKSRKNVAGAAFRAFCAPDESRLLRSARQTRFCQ